MARKIIASAFLLLALRQRVFSSQLDVQLKKRIEYPVWQRDLPLLHLCLQLCLSAIGGLCGDNEPPCLLAFLRWNEGVRRTPVTKISRVMPFQRCEKHSLGEKHILGMRKMSWA
jgi:hypothetical protein